MLNKGDIIYGNYNIPYNNSYVKAMCVENSNDKKYLMLSDIYKYKILLFPYSNNNILDMISTFEVLSSQSDKKFTNKDFFKELDKGDCTIYMNQNFIYHFPSNSKLQFYFKYMEGIFYKGNLYKIFLLPEDNIKTYVVNNNTNQYVIFD